MSAPEQLSNVEQMPLIGEHIALAAGAVLQRPSAEAIAWLQQQDDRVRYFPADLETAQHATSGYAYSRSVAERIGPQVQHDFPGQDISVRGTVAALTESFPYWDDDNGSDMRTVLEIVTSGSDTGADKTRVGGLVEDGQLNHHTLDWLGVHSESALMELTGRERDQVFPVLLVYPPEAFAGPAIHGWNQLTGDPDQRLLAVYVTDKIL